MKIHRIALSNVRGIEHLDLDEIPDTGFILITGPNEQGKSTVMDAVYTALFHKHTANNRDVKALQPIGKDVGSTIIVDATIGPYTLSVTKTFNKQRSAHLAITRPKVDNYTGADAERVLAEILEQHLDRSLFTALFVRQGELSHSLKAAGIPTLSSVLSGTDVADSAAQPTDNTALLDRVDEEYRRYYTLGKGAATGELKAAMDDVEQLTAEMHTAEQRVQDLAIYVDRVAALAEQKAAAEQRIPQIKDEIAQRELAFTAAEAAQNRVKQALQAAELASAAAENATRDWERRQDRITEVTQISAEVTDLTKQLADKHSERTHRDEQLAHLKERVELAKQQAATDAANLTAVNEQLHIIVGTQRLQELRRLIDAVTNLDAEIHKRRHSNAHIPAITTDMIDAAAQAEHAVLLATAKRDAHSAQLELSAAEAQSVMINGEEETIGAQPRTYEIVDTLDINVSGVRIRALPGQSQIDAQQAVVDRKEVLAEILDGTHCADVAELRSRYAEQQSAQEAVAALERERKATLQGRDLDSLQSEEATLVEQLGEDLGDPEQLSVLREQQTELSERYDVSFAAVDAAKAELDAARDHTIDVDIRVVEAQLKAASQRGDAAGARLADERSHDADSEIERRVQVTNAALMEARQAVDHARETAEQHDYHAASRLLDGARNELADAERQGVDTQEYCAKDVLRTIRLRSLARAREQAEPVSQHTYARFLQQWHGIAEVGQRPELQGADGVFAVVEQLAGVRLPASAWESWIFPTRVAGYQPTMLDELTTSGEVSIVGAGKAGARDPWIMLLPSDYAAELAPIVDVTLTPTQQAVVDLLARGGGFYFPELLSDVGGGLVVPGTMQATELQDTLWELVEMGMVTPDGFGPIRARLAAGTSGKSAHRAKRRPVRGRLRRGRTSFGPARSNPTPPDMLGRWSLAVTPATDATHRSIAHGEAWLERYGVVTRGSVVAEDTIGGFALAYKVLAGFEESGKATRGYLIDALGAAQFSTPAVVDRLRGIERASAPCGVVVLAAADPANPYGASLPWPEDGARLTRGAGALVVLNDAQPIAHLTRGGRTLTLLGEDCVGLVVHALGDAIARGMTSRITVEKVNGDPVLESALLAEFRAAGAHITPRGVSIGGAGSTGSRGGAGASGIGGRSLGEALAELGD